MGKIYETLRKISLPRGEGGICEANGERGITKNPEGLNKNRHTCGMPVFLCHFQNIFLKTMLNLRKIFQKDGREKSLNENPLPA